MSDHQKAMWTPLEKRIMRRCRDGISFKEIAKEFQLSLSTLMQIIAGIGKKRRRLATKSYYRESMERRKRFWVGKVALVISSKEEMLVRVHAMKLYTDGWYAELSNALDPDHRTFRIETIRWDKPALITRHYWHFPWLREQYYFGQDVIDGYLLRKQDN